MVSASNACFMCVFFVYNAYSIYAWLVRNSRIPNCVSEVRAHYPRFYNEIWPYKTSKRPEIAWPWKVQDDQLYMAVETRFCVTENMYFLRNN